MSIVKDVVKLVGAGFMLYGGEVETTVYDRVKCPKPKKAAWFVRRGTYLCMGCGRQCRTTGEGFRLLLPFPRQTRVLVADVPALTVAQLLDLGRPLRVDEAAWALNVTEREIYALVDEGRLARAGAGRPLRVSAESVREELG